MSVNVQTRQDNPYVGPRSFQKGEPIFGRDRELNQLFQLLLARRIILLHSPSGAGKTSLVQAGLIPRLEGDDFQVLPIARVNQEPPTSSTRPDNFNRYVYSLMLSLEERVDEPEKLSPGQLTSLSLAHYLPRHLGSADDPELVVLIIDQFEEVLTLDPTDTGQKLDFFAQLGQALQHKHLWALLVIREDHMGALAPFVRAIPTRLAHTYRLDLLGKEAASEAIQEPVNQAAGGHVRFAAGAVLKLVDDLRRMQVQQADGSFKVVPGPYVEPVQLQVVCYRLWQNLPPGKQVITELDVQDVGDVNRSLAAYYAERVSTIAAEPKNQVRERDIRRWIQNELITPEGIRIPVMMSQTQTKGLDNRVIKLLEDAYLVRTDKRGGKMWFELAHDRLVTPILENNAAWFKRNLNLLQQQGAEWEQRGRPEYLLLHGRVLKAVEDWANKHEAELSDVDRAFMQASVRQRDREEEKQKNQELIIKNQLAEAKAESARRRMYIIVGLSFAVLAALFFIFSIQSYRQQLIQEDLNEREAALSGAATLISGATANAILAAQETAAAEAADTSGGITEFLVTRAVLEATSTALAVEFGLILAGANATVQAGGSEQEAVAAATALAEAVATATALVRGTSIPTPTATPDIPLTATSTSVPEQITLPAGEIAFVSNDAIYVMEILPDGRTNPPRPLTQLPGYQWWPTWCENGNVIVFEAGDNQWNTTQMQLAKVEWDGSNSANPVPLTTPNLPPGSDVSGAPSCSPDGQFIAFSSRQQGAAGNEFNIYIAAYTSEGLSSAGALGGGYALAGHVGWSPDAQAVVFMHHAREERRFHIYRVNRSNPFNFDNLTANFADSCKYPAWSPTNPNQIAFACATLEGGSLVWGLYLYDQDTGQIDTLIPNLHTGGERNEVRQVVRHVITPSWSSDGNWIIYASDKGGDWDIYAYHLASGRDVNLTENLPGEQIHPRWRS